MNHQATARVSVWEKICNVFSKEIEKEFTRSEIIDLIIEKYPDTNKGSVIPSDYCYNMINKGISFQNHFFEHLETGHYKVLGSDYNYVGEIFWKGEQVGEWKKDENHPKFFKYVGK